jgi:hypothetical protein
MRADVIGTLARSTDGIVRMAQSGHTRESIAMVFGASHPIGFGHNGVEYRVLSFEVAWQLRLPRRFGEIIKIIMKFMSHVPRSVYLCLLCSHNRDMSTTLTLRTRHAEASPTLVYSKGLSEVHHQMGQMGLPCGRCLALLQSLMASYTARPSHSILISKLILHPLRRHVDNLFGRTLQGRRLLSLLLLLLLLL